MMLIFEMGRQKTDRIAHASCDQLPRHVNVSYHHAGRKFVFKSFLPPCMEQFHGAVIRLVAQILHRRQFFESNRLFCHKIRGIFSDQPPVHNTLIISADKAHINGFIQHLAEQHVALFVYDAEIDIRMVPAVSKKKIRKGIFTEGIGRSDHNLSFRFFLHPFQFFSCLFQEFQIFLRFFCQKVSFPRKLQSFGGAVYNLYLKFLFHMLNPFCQRWLRHIQQICHLCHIWIFMQFI